MSPGTVKTLVWGGVVTAVVGPTLMAAVMVSVGGGIGSFAGISIEDGLPALMEGFQNYEGGQSEGLFGEPPVGTAPGGPTNPGK